MHVLNQTRFVRGWQNKAKCKIEDDAEVNHETQQNKTHSLVTPMKNSDMCTKPITEHDTHHNTTATWNWVEHWTP